MMENQKPMCAWKLGEIFFTKNQIEIKPGSVPKNQNSYRKSLKMKDTKYKYI